MINVFNQTTIETELKALVKALSVSATVYDSRPTTTTTTKDDFVVAKVSGQITDMDAYGECVCTFHLFAKDLSGFKNTKKLSVMYDKLAQGLPQWRGKLLFTKTPTIVCDMPDDYGYHVRILNVQTTIKL